MPILFNGTTGVGASFIDLESPSALDNIEISGPTSGMTISFWLYPVGYGGANLGRIFAKGGGVESGLLQIRADNANVASSLTVFKDFSTTDLVAGATNGSLTLNSWQHFMVVWTGTSQFSSVTVFKNGSSAATAVGQNGAGTKNSDAAGRAYIGNESGLLRTFNGRISELAIWNAQLTAYDASVLGNSKLRGVPLQVNPARLVAYYPLDDFSNNVATTGSGSIMDRSVNKNHGTPLNATGLAEDVESYQ